MIGEHAFNHTLNRSGVIIRRIGNNITVRTVDGCEEWSLNDVEIIEDFD